MRETYHFPRVRETTAQSNTILRLFTMTFNFPNNASVYFAKFSYGHLERKGFPDTYERYGHEAMVATKIFHYQIKKDLPKKS